MNPSTSTALKKSVLEQFADNLAPSSCPNIDEVVVKDSAGLPLINSPPLWLSSPFSAAELKSVLLHVKDSSPGEDLIPYSFLRLSPPPISSYFLNLINGFFESGTAPTAWRSQIVVPIPKSGRDPENPKNFRPIALSSSLCKIVEHLVKNRLEWFLEARFHLSRSQFGFRRGMGTLDNISVLTTDIRLSFKRSEFLVAVFLDVQAAYDNVIIPLLRNSLLNLGVPDKLSLFICNILKDRRINILSSSDPISRSVFKGLPQGSVLSPILYNLYTRGVEDVVLGHCRILQYADDVVIYDSSPNLSATIQRISEALEALEEHLNNAGLAISPPKSSAVIFSRRKIPPLMSIAYKDSSIPLKAQAKFLGVTLDSKLLWRGYIDQVVTRGEKSLNILRAISGVWWGSHPFTVKLLHNCLIRSHIDYAAFICFPLSKQLQHKLNCLQFKGLRCTIGAMRSSPTNALLVESCEPPVNLRCQLLADRFYLKRLQLINHPLIPKLTLLSEL